MSEAFDSQPAPAAPSKSVFARGGLVFYMFLIIYASWYPFSGWRSNGLPLMGFLSAPLPYYWTKFDLLTNIVGYMPFGVLLVFSMYPRLRGVWAALLGCIIGALVSTALEAGQNFLPSRVPSNLDLITNATGAALGALCGALLTPAFLEQSRMLALRSRWFLHEASRGLIVLALWPLAQVYPQAYLFGNGQLLPIASDWLSDLWETQIDLGALLRRQSELSAEQYWLSETIITACGFTAAVLTLLCLTRRRAPRLALALGLIAAALAAKTLASALLFSPDNAFAWVTPGAEGGLLIGMIMLAGLALAPPVAQRRVAALALITSLLVVNLAPANPYFLSTLQTWVQGKFLNFNGAAQFLSLAWPFITLWFLYHPVHRVKAERG